LERAFLKSVAGRPSTHTRESNPTAFGRPSSYLTGQILHPNGGEIVNG
jgi:hypothetical protein